ncbi:MAG: esterase-like activity of phytase family protein, partial [Parvibaculaceae bacterium]|nr:esterase-like activity of phytase family protein [Parvibaculaceae bacterium]
MRSIAFKASHALLLGLSLNLAGCQADADPQRTAEPIPLTINASSVKWNLDDLSETHTGKLKYLGGIELSSPNANFGGLSGLHIDASGAQLLAISDQGHWLSAHIQVNDAGLPIGLDEAVLAPLLDETGAVLNGKANTDAEGLAVHETTAGAHEACVSFERKHRVLCYTYPGTKTPKGAARKRALPTSFTSQLENNGSLETLLFMEGEGEKETLLTIAEQSQAGKHAALLFTDNMHVANSIAQQPPYAITDAARIPSTGDLLLLERRYSPLAGVGLSLRRITQAEWSQKPPRTQPLEGEVLLNVGNRYSIDNMEGLSVAEKPDGSIWLHMISDDNFNSLQRTLLLTFEL